MAEEIVITPLEKLSVVLTVLNASKVITDETLKILEDLIYDSDGFIKRRHHWTMQEKIIRFVEGGELVEFDYDGRKFRYNITEVK